MRQVCCSDGRKKEHSAFARGKGETVAVKTCPVCKTKLFEDMDTCFGCMHRFGTDADSGARQRDDVEGETPQPTASREAGSAEAEVSASSGEPAGDEGASGCGESKGNGSGAPSQLASRLPSISVDRDERISPAGGECGCVEIRLEVKRDERLVQSWTVELPCERLRDAGAGDIEEEPFEPA